MTTEDARRSSPDNCAAAPPEPPRPGGRGSRWRHVFFGSAFLDGPNHGEYAAQWLISCGQGG